MIVLYIVLEYLVLFSVHLVDYIGNFDFHLIDGPLSSLWISWPWCLFCLAGTRGGMKRQISTRWAPTGLITPLNGLISGNWGYNPYKWSYNPTYNW